MMDHRLLDIPNYEEYLIFYKIMHYPIPTHSEYFLFEKKLEKVQPANQLSTQFSWHKPNHYMDEYTRYINKFGRLYRSIPFLQSIYLCNSISFNALKEDSDIDLFIVAKKDALRRARFFSLLFFWVLGLKRSPTKKAKKFCLSFYVTEDAQNLYNISLPKTDIYLSYRLAHLVPLYQEQTTNIYQYNTRLQVILPNFPGTQSIDIGTHLFTGTQKIKKILECVCGGPVGKLLEKLIKLIRLPIVIAKSKKHGEDGRGIVINNRTLKFHLDIRKKVRVNYNLRRKGIHKTIYGVHENQ